ncbi:protein-glutamine gamma-glutamyltransferase [Terrilactibacillus laevilacticus]|uniref:Protein-glutamine gamma-glutamyltransferase n=1 Tax=Terrilactibacillus laevilacticus TaxID=1380157 RepID=A0ABW5PPG1_9BACI|nr:protein-glutamine gamma-glutamyltransferase [Terrilactibacillus laevilacticus]
MILIQNRPISSVEQQVLGNLGPFTKEIVYGLISDLRTYRYPNQEALIFEIKLRQAIINAASLLSESRASFATFYESACNPRYWTLNEEGGFELRVGSSPSVAIIDIFTNGDQYAFECATAMMIILYKALIEVIGSRHFDQFYRQLYLWDWHHHANYPLVLIDVSQGILGDIRYFKNPEVNPRTPQWQGENAIQMPDQKFFGHGIGNLNANAMIDELNKYRRIGATASAYLMTSATRPDFNFLFNYTSNEMSRVPIQLGSTQYEYD